MVDEYVCFLHQKRLIAEFIVVTVSIYMLVAWHSHWNSTLLSIARLWGSQSSIDEDSGVLVCKTVSLGELFAVLWRFIVVSSSGLFLLGCLPRIGTPSFLETSHTTFPATRCHIPDDLICEFCLCWCCRILSDSLPSLCFYTHHSVSPFMWLLQSPVAIYFHVHIRSE